MFITYMYIYVGTNTNTIEITLLFRCHQPIFFSEKNLTMAILEKDIRLLGGCGEWVGSLSREKAVGTKGIFKFESLSSVRRHLFCCLNYLGTQEKKMVVTSIDAIFFAFPIMP